MYMSDFDLMVAYALVLFRYNTMSNDNFNAIIHEMQTKGIYAPRNGGSTFTVNFKIIQIAWYMFGYYDNTGNSAHNKKFVFSPLGQLYLNNIHKDLERRKIFLTMMFGNAFHQPFSQMDKEINIYPFRLVFKLLNDQRLDGKLYADEAFYLLSFVKTLTPDAYNNLVDDILELRSKTPEEKYKEFLNNQGVVGLSCHEWRYLFKLLQSAGLVQIHNDQNNKVIGTLCYGSINKEGRYNAARSYRMDYITLREDLRSFAQKLLTAYSPYEKPFHPEQQGEFAGSHLQQIVNLYSFYPKELLDELGIEVVDPAVADMLTVVNEITKYDKYQNQGDDLRFELALTNAFNLFADVQAIHHGGAGNTDVECIFTPESGNPSKFAVDGKSTHAKLPSVNIVRINKHRVDINGRYSIIVTPKYMYGALSDIKGQQIVLLKSSSFENFLYQLIAKKGRVVSYAPLHSIIDANLGTDVSPLVNQMVIDNFGMSVNTQGKVAVTTVPN